MTERFNNIAREWDHSDTRQILAQAVYEKIDDAVALDSTMNLIDLGVGTGLLAYRVLEHVNSIVGVDVSSGMLEELMKKATPQDSITALLKDLSTEPLDRQYDGVISSMTLHHIKELKALFENLHVNLKVGGFLALAEVESVDGSFHSDHTEGNEGVHHFGFDTEALRTLIESVGFKNVNFHHTHVVAREHRDFPIFLVTALKE